MVLYSCGVEHSTRIIHRRNLHYVRLATFKGAWALCVLCLPQCYAHSVTPPILKGVRWIFENVKKGAQINFFQKRGYMPEGGTVKKCSLKRGYVQIFMENFSTTEKFKLCCWNLVETVNNTVTYQPILKIHPPNKKTHYFFSQNDYFSLKKDYFCLKYDQFWLKYYTFGQKNDNCCHKNGLKNESGKKLGWSYSPLAQISF